MSTEQERDAKLAEAAGHIAGSVATFYFGPQVGALTDEVTRTIAEALLSADDDKYQKEILNRLNVIESKIDSIIRFLNFQLRDLVADALSENDIKNIISSLHTDMVELNIAVAMFKNTDVKTLSDGNRIVDQANKVLSSGYKLFERNPGRFLLAIPYLANAFASLRFCRFLDTKRYDQPLAIWAASYRSQIGPWLMQSMPGGTTFPLALKIAEDELANAKLVMKDFIVEKPGAQIEYVTGVTMRYIVGVAQIGNIASLPLCADFTLNADYSVTTNYIGGVGTAYQQFLDNSADLAGLASHANVRVHPTIRPAFGPARGIQNATEYWRYYSDNFYAVIHRSASVLANHPSRITALQFVIDTLDPFIQGLDLLASLKVDDQVLLNTLAEFRE